MDYVIAGVSGHTGAVVAETLLGAGAKVRVVVRDAAKGEAFRAKGVEVAVADLTKPAELARALAGAKGAFLLLPPNMAVEDLDGYQKATGEAILQAIKESKIPHVVFLSSVGAQHAAGTGPIKSIHPIEVALKVLPGTASTLVRAAYFMENLGGSLGALDQGVLPCFQRTDLAIDMVATRDIGKQISDSLREGATRTTIIELSGPRKYSMDDVAATLSTIVGKPVKAQNAGIDALVPTLMGFGLPKAFAEGYREMTAGLESGLVAFEGRHRSVRGATELQTVLRGLLKKN